MDEGSCENLPACTGHDSSSSEAIVSNFGECDVRSGCSDEVEKVEEDMGEDMEEDTSEVVEGDQEGKRKT